MADANSGEPAQEIPPATPEVDAVTPLAQAPDVTSTEAPGAGKRRWWVWTAGGVLVLLLLIEGIPWLITALRTVSTDDAYVNGHVTLVAPRVPGQIERVLVDDNNRVRKGDLLVQLDKEPYQVE